MESMTKPKRKSRGFEETLEQHGLYGSKLRDVSDDVDEYGLVRLVKRKERDKRLRIMDEEEEE